MITSTENTCCGCRACMNACPRKCINMTKNINGFLVPKVNLNLCINCGLCEKVCPIKTIVDGNVPKTVFAAYYKNAESRNSSSGAIFYCFAQEIIKNNGIVFGASFNKTLYCEHRSVEKESELKYLQGSKYVQSDTVQTYKLCREYLEMGRKVLYSGTPCQIAGLKKSLEVGGVPEI